MDARFERLPLPLVVHAPMGFHVLPRVGYAHLEILDPEARIVGQVRGSAERTRILKVVPVDALWLAELLLDGNGEDERSIATAAWEPTGGRYFPPLEITDAAGESSARVDDWNGISGHLATAGGERIARIDSPDPLSTLIRFHDPAGGPACEARRRGASQGREVFDWSGPEDFDARLVLTWLYAMAMRANH